MSEIRTFRVDCFLPKRPNERIPTATSEEVTPTINTDLLNFEQETIKSSHFTHSNAGP